MDTQQAQTRTRTRPRTRGPQLWLSCSGWVWTHPAGVHLHVPLGPDHVVLVGGHGDPGPGTEAGLTRPQGSVETPSYKHGSSTGGGGGGGEGGGRGGGEGEGGGGGGAGLTSPPRSAASPGPCEASVLQSCTQETASQPRRGPAGGAAATRWAPPGWPEVQGGGAAVPEPPFLRHLLVQVPLLTLLPGHAFVVGRESEDGPGPLVWTQRDGVRVQGSEVRGPGPGPDSGAH